MHWSPSNEILWECWFLCRICCSDALLCKLSRRSQNRVLRVLHHVPRFSDTRSRKALFAVFVCINGLVISRSSLWPFPESCHCFSHSFDDIRWCDWDTGRISPNCIRGAANTELLEADRILKTLISIIGTSQLFGNLQYNMKWLK
jgi:hypothetical protein